MAVKNSKLLETTRVHFYNIGLRAVKTLLNNLLEIEVFYT